MTAETWAEQLLDEYLKRDAEGSEETARRLRTCAICGNDFDLDDGKEIETCVLSPLRIEGKRPNKIYICNFCMDSADEIEGDY